MAIPAESPDGVGVDAPVESSDGAALDGTALDGTPATVVPPARTWGRAVAVGIGVGIGVTAIVFVLISIPFYTLASFEPNGLDRPIVRTGLFLIAGPVGLVVGTIVGVVAARWYRSGTPWTVDDGGSRYLSD